MKNKISIVTPCYNGAPYLNELAESILSQPYENWEWVICDDMSTDNSLEVIDSLVARDFRIIRKDAPSKKYYWWNPQKAASGDIVVPWDVDDKMFPNSLEIINYYFNKFPEVLAALKLCRITAPSPLTLNKFVLTLLLTLNAASLLLVPA